MEGQLFFRTGRLIIFPFLDILYLYRMRSIHTVMRIDALYLTNNAHAMMLNRREKKSKSNLIWFMRERPSPSLQEMQISKKTVDIKDRTPPGRHRSRTRRCMKHRGIRDRRHKRSH